MWWIILILACMVIGWGLLHRRDRSRLNAIQHRRRAERIDTESQRNTIHVIMVCMPGEEHDCAETLYSLFSEGEHPWRITVGLACVDVEVEGLMQAGPMDLYMQRCERDATDSFSANIVTHAIADVSAGPSTARKALFRAFSRKGRERYVMSLACGSKMSEGWDSKVVRMYRNAQRSMTRPCITAHPSLSTYTGFADTTLPTFSAIETSTEGFPQPRPIPFSNNPSRCYPTPIYSPKFAFAENAMAASLQSMGDLECASDAEALACTLRLVGDGWDLVSPMMPIVDYVTDPTQEPVYQHHDYHRRVAALADLQAHPSGSRSLVDVQKHTGVYLDGRVMPHARAGCTAHPSIEEKIAKFGEESVYQSLLDACED